MLKKTLVLALAIIMVLSLVVGCSKDVAETTEPQSGQPAEVAKEPVTIKFMQYTASGSQEETLKAMIDKFMELNEDIKVEYEVLAWADYYTKLNAAIAGNAAPDVFEVGYENFATYAAKDVIKDMNSAIANDGEFKENVFKKLAYDAFKYNGKQYGLPEGYSAVVLFYNKDLFDKNSVAYPNESWTWKEELEAAQKLTDEKNGIWGTYAPFQFWEFYKTIAQNGGSIWSSDNKSVTINSQANIDALQWMIDKSLKYGVSPKLNDDTFSQPDADLNAFKDGKLAMLRTGIWNFGRFADADFEWDIALEPGNTQKAHHFFADALVVSKDTKKEEAAWRFMKFMTSDPYAVSLRIEKGWSVPAIADEKVMASYYELDKPASRKVVNETLDSLVLPPVGPIPERWNEITGAVGEELEKAKLGRITAKEALENAAKRLQGLIK
ncbi:ABC transporter substrate-binding protein [Alkaliphilus serpentinus]|uniref:Sugar ABC transporter substrate-binding protein n=1 Tax=Alkaliphilus serpentinus TaxID=1482731 RepID=A0A833HLK8_9FIRM|nr:sugar ABC transporter substrate-binding protein [Alkaliphilus serpentinus]KAB3526223.1 sugar ABC transporter substrate-binding protein [Alkaliphilus serpentinus]